ncbi:MAG TPA: FliM/FliN family flagellar motor switch protein [Isosphaeraceae bacterium]|nr:FliM/FliN family flagellar motor switch protein [Isosphaeraceae bacterium]
MPAEHGPRLKTPDSDSPGGTTIAGEAGGEQTLELWSWLPRIAPRLARLEEWLARWTGEETVPHWLDWIRGGLKQTPEIGRPEIVWRASGLGRPGLIAQFRWPRLNTRLALGLEVPLAHAVVDHLLGYDRPFAESRLQLTPVEWGVWTYLVVRSLEEFDRASRGGPGHGTITAPADRSRLVLDRVGPDPFDPAGLGTVVTLRSSIRVGSTTGTARLWLPEPALHVLLASEPQFGTMVPDLATSKAREYSSLWRALAGLVAMPNGLKRLRTSGVLPLTDSRLTGTPQSPSGPIALVCGPTCLGETFQLPAEPVEGASGRLVRITGSLMCQRQPREPLTLGINQIMSSTSSSPAADHSGAPVPSPVASPLDVPVTLTVELGRVNLTLNRLADLRPGDLVELGRHSREPVELTSNGRLVARGELVLIDTELGVRVTHVFL